MFHASLSIIILLLFGITGGGCSIFSKHNKVCDQSGIRMSPFTGFKIYRQYLLNDLKPPLLHLVSLAHCQHGVLDYENCIKTDRETDIDWQKPFCYISPHGVKNDKFLGKKPVDIDHVPKKPHSVNSKIDYIQRNTKDGMKRVFKKFVSKLSFKKSDNVEIDADSSNLRPSSEVNDSQTAGDLTCYKLARRKRYAKRNLMIYAPYTFVGGIFKCEVPEKEKEFFLKKMKYDEDINMSFEFKCDAKTAIPLHPLLADDTSKQFVEKLKGVTILQRVPYLFSPGLSDFQYGKYAQPLGPNAHEFTNDKNSNESSVDSWFNEIEVNENYTYSLNDIGLLTQSVTNTINILNDFVKINPKYLPWEWNENKFIQKKQSLAQLEYKVLSIFSNMKNSTQFKRITGSVEDAWDSIAISREYFQYDNSS